MGIRIIADSGSDINIEDAAKLNVHVIPMQVAFGEEVYLDGKTITNEEFYEKLIETDELPKTSQINPYDYELAFEEANGDDIICFTISSKLSGCYQSANIAAANLDNVYIVDTQNVAVGERLLVELATQLRDKGLTAKEIVKEVTEKRDRLRILALLDTLEYLKKGGRISATAAVAGEMLSIKPVVTVCDGVVTMVGKARGSKNGNNTLISLVNKEGGIDSTLPYAVGYTGLSDRLIMKYLTDSKPVYESFTDEVPIHKIGSAIGTHVGPGAIAVAFFVKNN